MTTHERRQLLLEVKAFCIKQIYLYFHIIQNFGFNCDCELCHAPPDKMAANDAVRRQVVEVRRGLLQEGPGSAQAVLRQSIRWLSLMVEAGYNPDYQLDAIFMCFEASKVKSYK